jgi:hypothetical protein
MYDPLEPHRFPKRHEFVVQECRTLDVREVIGWLANEHPQAISYPAIRVAGFVGRYRDPETMAAYEEAACPSCDGDGCQDCKYSGCRCRGSGCSACTSYGSNRVGDRVQSRRQHGGSDLVLVRRPCGAARRWHFLCPTCCRRCEYLYLPPIEGDYRKPDDSPYAPKRGDWRCRKCWNLNYGSQHYGRTHTLRRQLPPRRALSRGRRLQGANRIRLKRFAETGG